MQGEKRDNENQSERIQIRSFWISNKQTPLVYNYFKNKSFINKGDMVFEIRDALTTGVALNNLVPGLASFIASLGDRLTLEKVISFINLMTDQAGVNQGLSNRDIEEIAKKIQSAMNVDLHPNSSQRGVGSSSKAHTGNTSVSETTDLVQKSGSQSNSINLKVAASVTDQDKAEYSHSLSNIDTKDDNLSVDSEVNESKNEGTGQGTQVDSAASQVAPEKRPLVKRNRQPLNQLGSLSK